MNILKKTFLLIVFVCSQIFSLNSNINIINTEDDSTVVEKYGQLRVEGNKVLDKNGNAVVLRGMSLFWSQWMGQFYNNDCIEWLKNDWECSVVRAAMGIEPDGYLQNPAAEKNKIIAVIEACIDLGIYVIVDWHDHNAHNHQEDAIQFFQEIASLYGSYPNVIYEIYNEPTQVSWSQVIKPYSQAVIDSIRSIDPDNIIIVGSSTWSQDVDIASRNPLQADNIVYSLHFYAATHKQPLRNKAITALNNGAALWVSEWGTCEANGSGILDSAEVERWLNFMEENKLSWNNWSIADKVETSAALNPGASQFGNWSASDLSTSGSLVREKIKQLSNPSNTETGYNNLPSDFQLYQNYPNPFNPDTQIVFQIPSRGFVSLRVYDALGKEVITLLNEEKQPGSYNIGFDGTGLASGIYFYHLNFNSQNLYRKAVLLY